MPLMVLSSLPPMVAVRLAPMVVSLLPPTLVVWLPATCLSRLERDGLVRSLPESEAGQRPYEITDAGRADLALWFDDGDGRSEASEIVALSARNIVAVGCRPKDNCAPVLYGDGRRGRCWDWWPDLRF